jgi:hypothetical protein
MTPRAWSDRLAAPNRVSASTSLAATKAPMTITP